jgi:hypothetical protein
LTTASNRYDKKRRAQHLALKDPFYKKIDAAREKKAREDLTKAKEPKATDKGSGSGSGSSKRSKKDKKSDKKGDKDSPEPEVCNMHTAYLHCVAPYSCVDYIECCSVHNMHAVKLCALYSAICSTWVYCVVDSIVNVYACCDELLRGLFELC